MSGVPSDYRKFYPCPNKDIFDPDGGQPEGYVTKDGSWAAIPVMGSKKKLGIVHNGEWMKICRNYNEAVSYIKKQISIEKKQLKKKALSEKSL